MIRQVVSITGRSAVWLARLTGGQEVAGSNPVAPIFGRLRPKIEQVSAETGEQVKEETDSRIKDVPAL